MKAVANNDKNLRRKWVVELNERQMEAVIDACEDIHRFLAGQPELCNSVSLLDEREHVTDALKRLHGYIAQDLPLGAAYSWNMGGCHNDKQRCRGALLYGIYRELRHLLAIDNHDAEKSSYNVYLNDTLVCEDSRPLPKARPGTITANMHKKYWRPVLHGDFPKDTDLIIWLKSGAMAVAAFNSDICQWIGCDPDQEYWWEPEEVKYWMPAPPFPE